jgi:hypothetical protein
LEEVEETAGESQEATKPHLTFLKRMQTGEQPLQKELPRKQALGTGEPSPIIVIGNNETKSKHLS